MKESLIPITTDDKHFSFIVERLEGPNEILSELFAWVDIRLVLLSKETLLLVICCGTTFVGRGFTSLVDRNHIDNSVVFPNTSQYLPTSEGVVYGCVDSAGESSLDKLYGTTWSVTAFKRYRAIVEK